MIPASTMPFLPISARETGLRLQAVCIPAWRGLGWPCGRLLPSALFTLSSGDYLPSQAEAQSALPDRAQLEEALLVLAVTLAKGLGLEGGSTGRLETVFMLV